jgi:hypothetical protein
MVATKEDSLWQWHMKLGGGGKGEEVEKVLKGLEEEGENVGLALVEGGKVEGRRWREALRRERELLQGLLEGDAQ